jgi:hypothetical protein
MRFLVGRHSLLSIQRKALTISIKNPILSSNFLVNLEKSIIRYRVITSV